MLPEENIKIFKSHSDPQREKRESTYPVLIQAISEFDTASQITDNTCGQNHLSEKVIQAFVSTEILASNDEQQNVKDSITEKQKWFDSAKEQRKSFFALIFLFLTHVSAQWQRFAIMPTYNYEGKSYDLDPAKYNMGADLQMNDIQYSNCAGIALNAPNGILSVVAGTLLIYFNRKRTISLISAMWSLSSIVIGVFAGGFATVFAMRCVVGAGVAFNPPCSYSLIADLYPPEKRAFANAIFTLGITFGQALSNISLIFVGLLGWRKTYALIGVFGLCVATGLAIFVREPIRFRFDQKQNIKQNQSQVIQQSQTYRSQHQTQQTPSFFKDLMQGIVSIFKNKCYKWIWFGGLCRFWQNQTVNYFMVVYFNHYEGMNTQYAFCVSICILIGGSFGYLSIGRIADWWENHPTKGFIRAKSYISFMMAILAVPLLSGVFLIQNHFYVNIACFFLYELFCDGWQAPSMAMIQQVVEPKYKELAVGCFMAGTTISCMCSSAIVGYFIEQAKQSGDAKLI